MALRLAVSGKLSAVVGAEPPKLASGGIIVTLRPAPKNTSPVSSARATWSSFTQLPMQWLFRQIEERVR